MKNMQEKIDKCGYFPDFCSKNCAKGVFLLHIFLIFGVLRFVEVQE